MLNIAFNSQMQCYIFRELSDVLSVVCILRFGVVKILYSNLLSAIVCSGRLELL